MYQREPQPYYAGLVSFFRTPAIEFDQVKEGMAVIAGVPIDNAIPTGRVGARFGPRAIREASMRGRPIHETVEDKTRIDVDTGIGLRLKDDLAVADLGDFNIYPTDLMQTTESVIQGMTEVTKRGAFPLVLGGDHYVAYPSFEGYARGFAERNPNARLGYIHLDSHTDFYDALGPGGGRYNHGTCVRRISENPIISLKNMAWVGLSGTGLSLDQFRLRRDHNLKMLTSKDVRERGIKDVMRDAMEVAADGVDAVYVSVDIDIVSGVESPGTGVPEFFGIGALDFLEAMNMFADYKELGALDLCEVAPEWDPTGRTNMLAANGLLAVLRPWLYDIVENPE